MKYYCIRRVPTSQRDHARAALSVSSRHTSSKCFSMSARSLASSFLSMPIATAFAANSSCQAAGPCGRTAGVPQEPLASTLLFWTIGSVSDADCWYFFFQGGG
eukprot:3729082-Pyramimonas_sp.AAC.1